MLVISTREFRENQGKYLGMAAHGEDVVLKSRGKGSFKLVPVTDDDTVVKREQILSPDADLARAITAEEVIEGIKKGLKEIFRQKNRQ